MEINSDKVIVCLNAKGRMCFVKKSLLIIFLIVFMLLSGCGDASKTSTDSSSNEMISSEDSGNYFAGYEGCFILYDNNQNHYTVYNDPKSRKQVSPCSSFKIVNALIGLETKVLEDENTTFKWDGTDYHNDAWNKDQTLASAISSTAFWYFQQNALKVGSERMQAS